VAGQVVSDQRLGDPPGRGFRAIYRAEK